MRNASLNVAYSTIFACRCRQIRPFVSFSPRIVLYSGSPLKSSHFLRHFSLHDCAGSSLRYPGAQWKLPLGYLFWCRAATFLRLRLSVHVSLQPTFPGCCLPAKTLISTLLLPHVACQLQAVQFLHVHAIACIVMGCQLLQYYYVAVHRLRAAMFFFFLSHGPRWLRLVKKYTMHIHSESGCSYCSCDLRVLL